MGGWELGGHGRRGDDGKGCRGRESATCGWTGVGRGPDSPHCSRRLSPALILTCPATPGVPSSPPRRATPAPGPRGAHRRIRATAASGRGPASPPWSRSSSDARVPVDLGHPRGQQRCTRPGSVPLAHPDLLGRATGGWGDSVGAGLTVPGPRATRGSGVQRWGLSTPPCHVPSQSELGLWGPNMSPRTGIRCDFFGQHHGSSGTKNKRGYFRVTLRRPFRV